MPEASTLLNTWENFYVIIGSSAGALTGLQFVVIALIAERRAARTMTEIRAFGTPTLMHFCAVLLISGIASTPWHSLSDAAWWVGICGVAGASYMVRVILHTRKQTAYSPDAGDWFWYTALPFAAYVMLLVAGIIMAAKVATGLFVMAASALALLFDGIHNAWDTVTYIALKHRSNE